MLGVDYEKLHPIALQSRDLEFAKINSKIHDKSKSKYCLHVMGCANL
mgnify:FL=1